MVGKRNARGIEPLQKKVSNQVIGFFNFVEQQDTSLVPRENVSKPSESAGFIAHEQLHVVQAQKLGHIEAENALIAEKIARKFQR